MKTDTLIERFAAGLLQARDTASLTNLPSQRDIDFDLQKGYEVGRVLHERLLERGFRSAGRKIGFTNPATWTEFNLNTPIWAHMYSQTVHIAENGYYRLSLSGMAAPRIEPEVVFKLKHEVPVEELSPEAVADCLEWVAIGFEIVDSHFPDWKFTAADAIADFGVHAALVVGPPLELHKRDSRQVAAQLPDLRVRLNCGTKIVAEGEGRNALGNPLFALGYLARVISAQPWAAPLTDGEIITTGTLTPLPYIQKGETWSLNIAEASLIPLKIHLSD